MTPPRARSLIPALLLVCLAVPNPASAFNKKVERACKGDYKRLCPQYKSSSPQMRACMEAKSYEISQKCVTALIDSGEVDRRRAGR